VRRLERVSSHILMETFMNAFHFASEAAGPWYKGRLIGKKLPRKLKEIWAIRISGSNLTTDVMAGVS
jgi:hypothetical protein